MNIAQKYSVPAYRRPTFKSNGKTVEKVVGSDFTVLVGSGAKDYPAFLSAAIDTTRNNAVYIAYRSGSDHNSTADGDMVMQIATTLDVNNAPVFADGVTIVAHGGRQLTDPALLVTSTGRIILFFLIQPTGKRQMWYVYSDDGGSTWSAETRMTTDYDDNQITGPGEAIEVDGIIYKPCYARGAGIGSREGVVYKSTDNGLTFTKMSNLMYPIENFNGEEPTLVKHPNGMLIGLVRSDPDNKTYWFWTPDEAQTVGWSRYTNALPSIGKNGMDISPSGTIFGVGRFNAVPNRTIFFYSNDMGKTWIYDNADDKTGIYEYGRGFWHPGLNQFMAIWSVETGTPGVGPCTIVGARFNEV